MSMRRPSRAKMCNWLSSRLHSIHITPTNPADIRRRGELTREAESKLSALASIASEMGWNADADLDLAWELSQEYDTKWHPKPDDSGSA